MHAQQPTILGLRRSFGYGDRLGLACPGHIEADAKFDFAGIFAQQSIRELTRTQRTPEEVMEAAQNALRDAGYDRPWGADADHLKTHDDVIVTSRAGYTFFTIDPSEFVVNEADEMAEAALDEAVRAQETDGLYAGDTVASLYLHKRFDIPNHADILFDKECLYRAAAKYGRAIAHCEIMAGWIAQENRHRPYEIEVSVDETDSPTAPQEHLFFALELRRRGVVVVSLAPRFIGDFEKGIDYRGDLDALERSLTQHVAIAEAYGPYKLSLHSGSDKLSIYPIFGRVCGNLLHVKTAGTSYLEALRVICRRDLLLFKEIACFSAGRFATDIASYHISTTEDDIARLGHAGFSDYETTYFGEDVGRQMLHVTFGSVLTMGKSHGGQPFKEAILEVLHQYPDDYREVLNIHFTRHLQMLSAG